MLDVLEAEKIVKQMLPYGRVIKHIEYRDLFIFMVFNNNQGEETMDPFFSINKTTGEFREFSIITDGDTGSIVKLFTMAKPGKG